MKINICRIYEKNILGKYDGGNREQYCKDYTAKQRDMLEMTLEIIKDNFPVEEYDDENYSGYLKDYHYLFMMGDVEKFTLAEWFDFLKSFR